MTNKRMELGARGEEIAAATLVEAGMQILDRNWRCRDGEIDIVALDRDSLVVCEVKTRRGLGYGTPLEAITHRKQRRLRSLAVQWARAHDCHLPLRIDAIGVLVHGGTPQVVHARGVTQ